MRFFDSETAAVYVSENGYTAQDLDENGVPVMAWMGNYDLNVFTPTGTQKPMAWQLSIPYINLQIAMRRAIIRNMCLPDCQRHKCQKSNRQS